MALLVREAGYEAQFLTGAREGFMLAAESAGYELIFVEPNIQNPTVSFALASFKADPRTAGIPVILPGPLAMEKDLAKFERRYPRVKFFLRPTTLETLKLQLDPLLASQESKQLTPAERAEYARRAVAWLVRLARGEFRGIDAQPAESALLNVLGDGRLGPDAIAAVVLLP